jgi:integrase
MNRARRPPLQHPLALPLARAIDSIGTALHPSTVGNYHGSVRHFLTWLGADYPEVCHLDQLRRDPHILGWLTRLRCETSLSAPESCMNRIGHIRRILNELAWTEQLPNLAQLIRRQDVPRTPKRLPRTLPAQQDELLQQEFLRRNDLGANVMLLLRHTGMRIGECADLPCDCLHSTAPDQWAIQVPLGKTKTERMVPVDDFVRQLVQRLRFFRALDPLPADGLLLARPLTKGTVIRQLRDYLHQVCFAVGLPTKIVPHQLRHTYASEMKLLGHSSPDMTMLYWRKS